jgi:hypothetical protein
VKGGGRRNIMAFALRPGPENAKRLTIQGDPPVARVAINTPSNFGDEGGGKETNNEFSLGAKTQMAYSVGAQA